MQFRASVSRIGAAHAVRLYDASGSLRLERHAMTEDAALRKAAAEVALYHPGATVQVRARPRLCGA